MADSKISDLTELTSLADSDEFAVVDKSDTTQAVTGSTKKVLASTLASRTETLTNKTIDATSNTISNISVNAPQGFLLNGKIVPSVSSNNLTVALKTLAGTDPSASAPVYIRIGDTVRSVTSALSVTKNAGTNWMNAGSSELATKEIDYFVYLGYNATDGVTIGFSRIPYGTQYGDFSATTTNEKYCAISTITNASSTDYYENVGRFAATLSAGAGYTWSVPTFTPANLIQRPIYETRWSAYASTLTWTASAAPTGGTNLNYRYQIRNNNCYVKLQGYSMTAGTAVTNLVATLPIKASPNDATNINFFIAYLGPTRTGTTTNLTHADINFNSNDITVIATSSAATQFQIQGEYRIT